jgi:hypothetical protein
MGLPVMSSDTQSHDVEQEHLRKKVKRVTGELEVLETYFQSFNTLIKQSLPNTQPLNKVIRSIEDSIEYMKDLGLPLLNVYNTYQTKAVTSRSPSLNT